MPKAVYRSGCRDKHNQPRCDSNLGFLTPQSDTLTTRPLRPAVSISLPNLKLSFSTVYLVKKLARTRQRRGCDLNPGSSAPESSTLPSHH